MRTFIFGLFLLTTFTDCHRPAEEIQGKRKLKVTLELIPEGDSSYSISWKDTIGQSNRYTIINRPIELWCFVKKNNDTIGDYHGLSTPRNFTYFATMDSVVILQFRTAYNYFSNYLGNESPKMNPGIVEYSPVTLNIKNSLKKEIDVLLTEE